MFIADESFELGPEMAVFAPANTMHKIDVGPDEDLTYVLIYAPPGPEKLLKAHGEHAFDKK
jgi:mannose-6-phosphate isomerase-like protein (cupin superfamily)